MMKYYFFLLCFCYLVYECLSIGLLNPNIYLFDRICVSTNFELYKVCFSCELAVVVVYKNCTAQLLPLLNLLKVFIIVLVLLCSKARNVTYIR